MELHLMRPEWLWSLVPAALLGLALWRGRNAGGSWSSVIAPELLPYLVGEEASGKRPLLLPWLLLAWVLAALAASGPSWQKIPQPVHQKQDALVLVLDLSYSMKAADLAPSRVDRARQKLLDLLEQRREGQTGLIAYAGDSHIVTPLTDDTPTIANLLPALHPDMMPVPGSDPVAAVSQAIELLHSAGVGQGRILLLTDGIAEHQQRPLADVLRGSGMQLGIVGIGTATGAPIPLPRGGFLKNERGAIVMPGLEEQSLRQAAQLAGGRYRRMQIDNSDFDYLLSDDQLAALEQTLALDRTADAWEDQGHWLVLLLLPLVLALFRRGWLFCLLPLALFTGAPAPAQAGLWDDLWLTRDQQGQRALAAEDAESAAQLFEDPDWAGTAAYRNGDYEGAIEQFKGNASADGWYNRGNALARAGQLEDAIEAYRESLELAPEQRDAEDNIALLEQLLEQQQQQQQQGEGQQGDQQENQEQDQQQQGEDQQGQQGQQDQQGQQSAQDQDGQQQDGEGQQQPGQQPDSQEQQADQQQQQPGSEEQSGEQEQPATAQAGEEEAQDEGEQPAQLAEASADPQEQERQQAMEQWLRRVPDDPSGLLREKFRYESRQRQQQGQNKDDDIYW